VPTQPPPALTAHLDAIETALQAAIGNNPSPLDAACRYVMGWEDEHGNLVRTGGKRIRPALSLFAATLFGADPLVAMPGAVAVELVHNFSLVHDEIQDHDAERHHRPTAWARLGEAQAINVGDLIYARAIQALVGSPAPADRKIAALEALNEAIARMIAGQWADLSFESRDDISPDEYLAMVAGKTGAILGVSFAIGALMAGASAAQADALARWGETVGLAFQVQDDILGIWGDPNLTGKTNVGDIARRKKTLPIVHALQSPHASRVAEIYSQPETSEADIRAVVAALEAAGSADHCRREGSRLLNEATTQLASFELPESARRELETIGQYLLDRDR